MECECCGWGCYFDALESGVRLEETLRVVIGDLVTVGVDCIGSELGREADVAGSVDDGHEEEGGDEGEGWGLRDVEGDVEGEVAVVGVKVAGLIEDGDRE